MMNRALTAAFAATLGIAMALPAHAQMRTSAPSRSAVTPATEIQPVVGPTRFFMIPRSDVLPNGESVTSAALQVSTTAPVQVTPGIGVPAPTAPGLGLGFGYSGNALSLANQTGMGPFQLDTGITAYATTPWQGRLDLAGKMGILQQQFGIPLNIAGVAGAALNIDANGTPSLGFNVGIPIGGAIAFTPMNRLSLTLYPNWGTGLVAPGVVGAGIVPSTRFALGVGGAVTLTDTLALLADTSILATTPGAPSEGGNLGLRFGYSPNVTFDLWAGMAPTAAVGTTPINVGLGLNWQY